MALAPTFRSGYALTGRRRYLLPAWLWIALTRSLLDGSRRPVAADAERVLAAWQRQPVVQGTEHIPRDGPLAIIANHYQRRGLWIGFAGGVLAREVRRARTDRASVHFAVVADIRVRGRKIPGSGALLQRVARIWDMVSLPTDASAKPARAAALRRLFLYATPAPRGRGEPILLFPEGAAGTTAGVRDALPGTGVFLALLARAGVPVVPAGVWESNGGLHARFGEPWFPEAPPEVAHADRDTWLRRDAMRRIASLLPPHLRGGDAEPSPAESRRPRETRRRACALGAGKRNER